MTKIEWGLAAIILALTALFFRSLPIATWIADGLVTAASFAAGSATVKFWRAPKR